ncbi:MAG: hypothetical protein JXB14_05915 [Candidatus Altiarchaeota archaeon]|nr:hypothetical protein [Candidatus Altiarchaeota archaeon]
MAKRPPKKPIRPERLPFSLANKVDNRIDPKNRLSIPKNRMITDRGLRTKGTQFLLAQTLVGRHRYLVVVPADSAIESLHKKFRSMGIEDSIERGTLVEHYKTAGETVALDGQGRILLPKRFVDVLLRDPKDRGVTITAEGTHLRIWHPEDQKQYADELRKRAARIAEKHRRRTREM